MSPFPISENVPPNSFSPFIPFASPVISPICPLVSSSVMESTNVCDLDDHEKVAVFPFQHSHPLRSSLLDGNFDTANVAASDALVLTNSDSVSSFPNIAPFFSLTVGHGSAVTVISPIVASLPVTTIENSMLSAMEFRDISTIPLSMAMNSLLGVSGNDCAGVDDDADVMSVIESSFPVPSFSIIPPLPPRTLDFPISDRVLDCVRHLLPFATHSDMTRLARQMTEYSDLQFQELEAVSWGSQVFDDLGIVDIPESMISQGDEEFSLANFSIQKLAQIRFDALALQGTRLSVARIMLVTQFARDCFSRRDPLCSRMIGPGTVLQEASFLHDIQVLSSVASEGMFVFTSPSFVPSNIVHNRIPLQFRKAGRAINAHLYSNLVAGEGIVVSRGVADQIPNLHVQNLGWTSVFNKPKGRLTSNLSGNASGSGPRSQKRSVVTPSSPLPPPSLTFSDMVLSELSAAHPSVNSLHSSDPADSILNSSEAKEMCEEYCGSMHPPTFEYICQMLVSMSLIHGRDNICMFKEDVKGAFKLLSFQPSCVNLMGFALHASHPSSSYLEGSVFLSLWGNFGWTGLPFYFEVVTRVFRVVLALLLVGIMIMFCDDFIVVCPTVAYVHDQSKVVWAITTLLGNEAYEKKKSESSLDVEDRSLECLGWLFILSTWQVTVAKKNLWKALFCFWNTDETVPLPLHLRQRLCSYAQRYSIIYRELKVLLPLLNGMLAGSDFTAPGSLKLLTLPQQLAVRVWKTMFVVAELQRASGNVVSRSIDDFVPRNPDVLIVFDGSLRGAGWRIKTIFNNKFYSPTCQEVCLESGMCNFIPLGLVFKDDSQYQNLSELIAVVCSLLHLALLGYRDVHILLRGDSTTALTWASTEHFRSRNALAACMALLSLSKLYGFHIHPECDFVYSADNECDPLSREEIPPGFQIGPLHSGHLVSFHDLPFSLRLINFVDPFVFESVVSNDQFLTRWSELDKFFISLCPL